VRVRVKVPLKDLLPLLVGLLAIAIRQQVADGLPVNVLGLHLGFLNSAVKDTVSEDLYKRKSK
jgi:hypothetical protein